MSIFAIWASERDALVMVDTDAVAVGEDRAPERGCKLIPLPAANTVVVYRGISTHFAFALTHFLTSTRPHGSFDDLVALVPAIFDELPEAFDAPVLGYGDAELELALVGWSDKLQAMASAIFRYTHGEAPQIGEPMVGMCAMVPLPDDRARWASVLPDDPAAYRAHLRAVAQEMVAYGRASDEGRTMGFGGSMIVAAVARDGCRVGDYGPID
ncbi:hypothetical protein N799_13425 [Lysobacter arseniciresistens ZS79]|uniref:Uncharacterized protein n=1 Tax=Lysobacter arseniciresistens ZS79 TaxID=913325 RepID=A0A0A0EQ66_9GAMM|nr:hypothetical protein [Lysobacter arseniciresistens]KGM52609.1 hypothetical protein N799_13425 [Lysobacter arseniciresistens ZS79]